MKRMLKLRLVFYIISIVLMVGCGHLQKTTSGKWITDYAPKIIGVWEYPGGQAEKMQMIFEPGGRLIFKNGFEDCNPARWEYNPSTDELRMTINYPVGSKVLFVLDSQVRTVKNIERKYPKNPEIVKRFSTYMPHLVKKIDDGKIQIQYFLSYKELRINFGNWIYSKK